MFPSVVTDGVNAAINGVGAEISHGNCTGGTTHECLKFGLVKHGEPGRLDDGSEAAQESICLEGRLVLQTVSGHVGDVDETIGVCDGEGGAIGDEVVTMCFVGVGVAWLVGMGGGKGDSVCYGEV